MSCELSIDQLAEIAVDVVRVGMAIALDPPCDLAVDTKSNRNDLVTAVDRAIEEEIAARLEEATGLPLLGEEGHAVDSFAGRVWVLDPIDGTMNYVETHRDYAVSLALCEDGEPVLGVVADVVGGHVCHAIRGRGAWLDGVPLPRAQDASSYREAIVITDIKEILALPRLARALQESRGHRRYGSAALECVEVARVPSCTCGYPRGISRRRPLLRPSAGRWQRGWTVRPLTCATRVRSFWLLPASMPRWWRGS